MKSSDEQREFFCCPILMGGEEFYIIWFSDDVDGVWISSPSRLAVWKTEEDLREFALQQGIDISNERIRRYDFDAVAAFISSGLDLSARDLLAAWNLLVDIAASINNVQFVNEEQKEIDIYNHLFYLTGAAPVEGTNPDPLSSKDIEGVHRILRQGLEMLKSQIG